MASFGARSAGLILGLFWSKPLSAEPPPSERPRIYMAEAVQGASFLPIWAAVGRKARQHLRPVVAMDVLQTKGLKAKILQKSFNALPLPRGGFEPSLVGHICAPLQAGESLIVFLEGLRVGNGSLLHAILTLAPDAELVPVSVQRARRFGLKMWSLRFGAPMELGMVEDGRAFMLRVSGALGALR